MKKGATAIDVGSVQIVAKGAGEFNVYSRLDGTLIGYLVTKSQSNWQFLESGLGRIYESHRHDVQSFMNQMTRVALEEQRKKQKMREELWNV